jgi:predicted small lipoprotein YifL
MRFLRVLPFALLAACGQSGDLYLPAEPPAASPPAAPAQPPADEKDDKDKK